MESLPNLLHDVHKQAFIQFYTADAPAVQILLCSCLTYYHIFLLQSRRCIK